MHAVETMYYKIQQNLHVLVLKQRLIEWRRLGITQSCPKTDVRLSPVHWHLTWTLLA